MQGQSLVVARRGLSFVIYWNCSLLSMVWNGALGFVVTQNGLSQLLSSEHGLKLNNGWMILERLTVSQLLSSEHGLKLHHSDQLPNQMKMSQLLSSEHGLKRRATTLENDVADVAVALFWAWSETGHFAIITHYEMVAVALFWAWSETNLLTRSMAMSLLSQLLSSEHGLKHLELDVQKIKCQSRSCSLLSMVWNRLRHLLILIGWRRSCSLLSMVWNGITQSTDLDSFVAVALFWAWSETAPLFGAL